MGIAPRNMSVEGTVFSPIVVTEDQNEDDCIVNESGESPRSLSPAVVTISASAISALYHDNVVRI